ncbi:hypothetical protein UF75_1514 [Desulfosporosinus sp. I2]|nr:hypothetical protein UF75_1514 [Desulfosporosinus sp. I2]
MNIRYLHERLSRIEEITVVGKNTVVDGVICHVMGVVRYGNVPDFRTINSFRGERMKDIILEVFSGVVEL